jgi:thiol-disulfide isomerase/thioredoxin
MNAIWITSMVLQWAVILVLGLLVFSLMRQLGALTATPYREKNPDDIFVPFTELPEQSVELLDGNRFHFAGQNGIPTLIVFFAPNCDACQHLPGALLELARKHAPAELKLLAVLKRTDRAHAKEFIREKGFKDIPLALDTEFPEDLNPGGAPYAAAIANGGTVAAHGKPKSLEHLLEMAQAAKMMDPAVPSHSRRKHEWGESAPYWVPEQMGLSPATPL